MIALALVGSACSGSEQRALDLAAQAEAQADAGELVAARETIAQAVAERDDLPALHVRRGRIALRAGAYEEAYGAYSDALTRDATNIEALQMVAQIDLAMGRHEDAEETADRILALQPGEPDARFVKGSVQLAQRRVDEADKQADEILSHAPQDERGLALKARALFARGEADRAIALLESRSEPATRSDLLARTLVELYRATGRSEPALAELSRIVARQPNDLDSALDRTRILYRLGRTAEARTQGSRLLTRQSLPDGVIGKLVALWQAYDPNPLASPGSTKIGDEDAKLAVARYYLLQGRHDRALAALEGSRTPDAVALRWRIAMSNKPSARGAQAVGAILDSDKTQCDALLARGLHSRSLGRIQDAIRDAEHAVHECPGDAGSVLELAQAYRARGDLAAEFRAFDKGLANDPQSLPVARAYFNRALEAKDHDRARGVARRLTGAVPSLPAGWAMLVRACSLAGDTACTAAAKTGLAQAKASLASDPRPGDVERRGALLPLQR